MLSSCEKNSKKMYNPKRTKPLNGEIFSSRKGFKSHLQEGTPWIIYNHSRREEKKSSPFPSQGTHRDDGTEYFSSRLSAFLDCSLFSSLGLGSELFVFLPSGAHPVIHLEKIFSGWAEKKVTLLCILRISLTERAISSGIESHSRELILYLSSALLPLKKNKKRTNLRWINAHLHQVQSFNKFSPKCSLSNGCEVRFWKENICLISSFL